MVICTSVSSQTDRTLLYIGQWLSFSLIYCTFDSFSSLFSCFVNAKRLCESRAISDGFITVPFEINVHIQNPALKALSLFPFLNFMYGCVVLTVRMVGRASASIGARGTFGSTVDGPSSGGKMAPRAPMPA